MMIVTLMLAMVYFDTLEVFVVNEEQGQSGRDETKTLVFILTRTLVHDSFSH